jgi:FkbH-like protein
LRLESPAGPASPGHSTELKHLLAANDPAFWEILREATLSAQGFAELAALSTWRKRAVQRTLPRPGSGATLRLAMIGGASLFPLRDLVQHFLEVAGHPSGLRVELFTGSYDNYVAEIMQADSDLYAFRPEVIFVLPSSKRCAYPGALTDSRERPQAAASKVAADALDLCRQAHEHSRAEIVLANYLLPSTHDPGPYRTRSAASEWTFRKLVNLELGLNAPSSVHLCDVEFLGARFGTLRAFDARAWFESKQPYAADFQVEVAREVNHIVGGLRGGAKKVVALDLDNTLWGGVVGDDGLEGIEIGDTSPRGEAFKAFQAYLKSLTERGVLLGVCSKNDRAKAAEPFEKHPEMVLRMGDFASFQANWEPKSENLRRMAKDLNLGLDSFVFVDDNPAEIEIVKQFVPEVATVLLSADPSAYATEVQEHRFFEPHSLTAEDGERSKQYQQEARREELLSSATDMASYLESLEMTATIAGFQGVDAPRISQLINKSNQFNLTGRRRTEAEVRAVMESPTQFGFTVRLADKFGDHGLIAVVVGDTAGKTLEIDTWLMSCRVLKRQVEEEVVNEILRLARLRGCERVRGRYIPTAKNGMVRDLYPRMGFEAAGATGETLIFELADVNRAPQQTAIRVVRRANDAG